MKNKKLLFGILTIILILFVFVIPNCYGAADLGLGDLDQYNNGNTGSEKLESMAGKIVTVVRNIGIVISVVALILIGIKYMLGSVEEKADYKKSLIPYVIGAFLVFTISLLPELIYQFMQNF